MTQIYHDKVTKLFDEYYREGDGEKPSPSLRIERSNAIIEDYIDNHDKAPPNAVLSRLATYILLDDLSDPHPDKMTREEYPIMSYGQTGRYFARNGGLKDEPYDHGEVIGYTPGLDKDGKSVRNALLNSDNAEQRAQDWRLFIRGILSEREAFIVERVYEDGASHAEVAENLSVSRQRVGAIMSKVLVKINEALAK